MEIRIELEIAAPADAVWAVVGERFGDIAEWASSITASSIDRAPGEGAVRTCHVAGFGPAGAGVIKERLTRFDPAARAFTYQATEGLPGFIVYGVNRWSVRSLGAASCQIRIHATLTLKPLARLMTPILRWRLRRDIAGVLEELRYRVEKGQAHPRKVTSSAANRTTDERIRVSRFP